MLEISDKLLKLGARYNLVSLCLRGASIAGKFCLLLYLGKTSSMEVVGIYGLFVTTIVVVNYLQGLEFHAYASRELLKLPSQQRSQVVFNQLALFFSIYLLVLPLALLVFFGGLLSFEYLSYFFVIVVLTHLGLEIGRTFIVVEQPQIAYFIQFCVHGLWPFAALLKLYFYPQDVLQTVFLLWAVSAGSGVLIGVLRLHKMNYFNFSTATLDKPWIARGLRTCWMFFVAAIAIKVIELSDRYFIAYMLGNADLGVYTLYSGFANVVQEVSFVCVAAIIFPVLINCANQDDDRQFTIERIRLRSGLIKISVLAAVLLLLFGWVVFSFMEKPALQTNFIAFLILVVASVVVSISLAWHYVLYALGKDYQLMWAAVAAMILNLGLNLLLIPSLELLGAALATLLSLMVLAAMKFWFTIEPLNGHLRTN